MKSNQIKKIMIVAVVFVLAAAVVYGSDIIAKAGNLNVTGNLDVTGGLTADTNTLKVDSANDRVGIGTASPTTNSKLHILRDTGVTTPIVVIEEDNAYGYATLQLDRASTARSSFVQFSTGGTGNWIMGHGYDGGVANSDFGIFQGSSLQPDIDTAILRIKANGNTIIQTGNVGIGTSSPNQALTIAGNINFTSGYNIYSAGPLSLNPTYLILPDNLDRYVSTSAKYFGRDTTGGYNVSIGFTASNAQSQLKVYGKGYGGGGYIGLTHDMTDGKITTSVGDIILEPQTGNVGIGTAAPTQALHVVGNANVTGNVSSNGRKLDAYVPRFISGVNYDFYNSSFPTVGSFVENGLNLSSIVPAGAKLVQLYIYVAGSATTGRFDLRYNATYPLNAVSVNSLTTTTGWATSVIMPLDSDRKIDYLRNNNQLTDVAVAVIGWWI